MSEEQALLSQISLDHWAVGFLVIPPTVGSSVFMVRWLSDGRLAWGEFNTSLVVSVDGQFITTEHSVYKIEPVDRVEVFLEDGQDDMLTGRVN